MLRKHLLRRNSRRGAIIQNPYGGGVLIGSIGSVTFQRGRYGNLAHARTKPVDPNTPRQQDVKIQMTIAAAEWNTLTVDQVQDWISYAANTKITGPKGNQINLDGRGMFMRSRMFQLRGGFGPLLTAPTLPGELPIPAVTITYDTVTGDVILTGITNEPATGVVRFLTSINLRNTRRYWKGPFQQTFQYDTAIGTPALIANHTPFPLAGNKVFIQYKAWSADSNAVGPSAIVPVLAAAVPP